MNIPTGQSIHEAYFGKNKNLLEFEKNIDTIRKKYGTTTSSIIGGTALGLVEKCKEWTRCREILEKEFGFYSVSFLLWRSTITNACTLHISHSIDGALNANKYVEITNRGMRYKPEAKFCTFVWVSEGLLFSPSFTPGEITAILLHEIGHNFDTAVYRHISPWVFLEYALFVSQTVLTNPVAAPLSVLLASSGARRTVGEEVNKMIQEKWWPVYDTFSWLMGMPKDIIQKLFRPVLIVLFSALGIMRKFLDPFTYPAMVIELVSGYSSEVFADKFPAMYGYGPEMTTGLAKFETEPIGITEEIINKIPLIGHAYGLYCCGINCVYKLFDPHPEYISRVRHLTSAIESDLDDPRVDKKTKLEIKRQVAEINKNCDGILKNREKYGYSAQMALAYQDALGKIFPKGDIKSIILQNELDDKKMNDTIHSIKMR